MYGLYFSRFRTVFVKGSRDNREHSQSDKVTIKANQFIKYLKNRNFAHYYGMMNN